MHWPAFSGSALLHLAAAIFASLPGLWLASDRSRPAGRDEAGWTSLYRPRLFVFTVRSPPFGYGASRSFGPPAGDAGCPPEDRIDRDAAPDFPVFGTDGPLAWIPPTDGSPAFCALIGADGRIASIYLTDTSGDRRADAAILSTIRGLPFIPAQRSGVATPAWHRLVVNQVSGLPDARDGMGEPPLPPVPVAVIVPHAPLY